MHVFDMNMIQVCIHALLRCYDKVSFEVKVRPFTSKKEYTSSFCAQFILAHIRRISLFHLISLNIPPSSMITVHMFESIRLPDLK